MTPLLRGLLLSSTLVLVAATPVDFAKETKVRAKGIQDDVRKVEAMTREVIQLSRDVENSADRIHGPNDVQDIKIVETKMDVLRRQTREALEASARVKNLAKGIHDSAQDLVAAQGNTPARSERGRGKR